MLILVGAFTLSVFSGFVCASELFFDKWSKFNREYIADNVIAIRLLELTVPFL